MKKLSTVILLLVTLLLSANAEEKADKKPSKGKKDYSYFQKADQLDEGLFTVYEAEKKYYFEITEDLLQRDMLLGARVSEISSISKVVAGEIRKNPILIQFDKDDEDIYLNYITTEFDVDESENIATSVERHRLTPVLEVFPIVAYNSDSTSYIIDVTSFFAAEIKVISPFNSKYKLGSINKKATKVLSAASYPENIEMRTRFAYTASNGKPEMAIMHRSLMLLPEEPMRPRYEDKRMGYFASTRKLFSEEHVGMETKTMISRFDLSIKPEDIEKYKAGELVEPAKPIKYYVDNAFPDYLQVAIVDGIQYWQAAFEAIGFKNAITAEVYPTDDPEFNPDDIRYSCIRYISQNKANAMGPNWSDPRSGEVICGDVFWWHDVTVRLRNWMFIQCGPNEPKARLERTDKGIEAEMAAYVVAHEVGHNLGLKHNMSASYAYPVDSLRSAKFTQEFGTTPSIMDYARFNYVAQPGDEGVRLLPPHLGVYDYHVIKWGYQPILDAATPEDEYETLNRWILEKKDDPRYFYGDQQMPLCLDPSAQAEALGDDAIKASVYGVKNLKYIMDHLIEWTTVENGQYDFMREIHKEVIKQHQRYIGHVNSYIGGVYRYIPVEGETEAFFTPVAKEKQQEALKWIFNEMEDLSTWAYPEEIARRVGNQNHELYKAQATLMDRLMSKTIIARLEQYHTDYTVKEYFDDLSELVWKKALDKDNITKFERHLQATYVRNLVSMSDVKNAAQTTAKGFDTPKGAKTMYTENFVAPIINTKRAETTKLLEKLMKTKDEDLEAHYQYLHNIIAQ